MNVSLYQAAAAMNANSRWQEIIAENLASSSIPGARKQQASFSAVQAGMLSGITTPGTGQVLIPAASSSTSFQQGTLSPTGLPTDLAVEGPGFLEVQLPNGSSAFTRDGELHFDANGQLVTKKGYPVMSDAGPLTFDPNNPATLSIAPTGEVSQGGDAKGTLRVVEFSQPNLLQGIGDGYFLANNPQLQKSASTSSRVHQNFLEAANTSPTTEMASLITSMRMFEANQKVMQMQDERMGRVITDLGSPN